MTSLAGLIKDPSPGTTPGTGAIIETDMHNAIVDYLSGENAAGVGLNIILTTAVKTSNYTMTEQDVEILANAIGGSISQTLPDATTLGIKYKIFVIKKTDSSSNTVTIATTAAQTIDNSSNFVLTQQNETLLVQSDGSNWRIIDHYLGKRFDQLEIVPVLRTALLLDLPSAPVGSSSPFRGAFSVPASTIGFVTTNQTGDYETGRIDQATLTNVSSATITNATTLKLIGAPIAGTNVTITNAYSLWVAAGTTLLQATTMAGTLTMSSANIALGANNITTTTYTLAESSVLGHASWFIKPTSASANAFMSLATSQATGGAAIFYFNRVSDVTTNYETMAIGSDVLVTGEFSIQSLKGGTGTIRPINVYMQTTKLLSFDTANTITAYVPLNLSVSAGGVVLSMLNSGATDQQFKFDNGTNNMIIGFGQHAGGGVPDGLYFSYNSTNAMILKLGMQLGSPGPTGGDKGNGTINVSSGVYLNGTAYTNPDYVFEKYYTGNIVKFAENDGAKDYQGLRTISDLENYVKSNYKFPIMDDKKMDLFRKVDKMLLISEELALYLFDHEKRLKALENN